MGEVRLRRLVWRRTIQHVRTPEFERSVQQHAREPVAELSEAVLSGGLGTSSEPVPKRDGIPWKRA